MVVNRFSLRERCTIFRGAKGDLAKSDCEGVVD